MRICSFNHLFSSANTKTCATGDGSLVLIRVPVQPRDGVRKTSGTLALPISTRGMLQFPGQNNRSGVVDASSSNTQKWWWHSEQEVIAHDELANRLLKDKGSVAGRERKGTKVQEEVETERCRPYCSESSEAPGQTAPVVLAAAHLVFVLPFFFQSQTIISSNLELDPFFC